MTPSSDSRKLPSSMTRSVSTWSAIRRERKISDPSAETSLMYGDSSLLFSIFYDVEIESKGVLGFCYGHFSFSGTCQPTAPSPTGSLRVKLSVAS